MKIEEAIAEANKIEGWMEDCQFPVLYDLCKDCNYFVEIGSFRGKTTKFLALMCPGKVITIDHFAGAPDLQYMAEDPQANKEIFCNNLAEELKSNKVILWPWDSHRAAQGFKDVSDRQYIGDCVFIDGNHEYEGVKQDILDYMPLVRPGGILSGHDYCCPFEGIIKNHLGVSEAVHEILRKENIEVKAGIWIWRKPL